jgi:hypothetical protein
LSPESFGALLGSLRDDGYRVLGPRVREGAIVYGEVSGLGDFPAAGGRYRRQADTG